MIDRHETVELANGDYVYIDKWICGKISGGSLDSRQVTAYEIEFGFAQAWPGRLIMGRHTADLFGFKDAPQRQWVDARRGPGVAATQYNASASDASDTNGMPDIDTRYHATAPKPAEQTVTAMGTTYVGENAYKHGNGTHWVHDQMLKYSYITMAALARSAPPTNRNPPEDEEEGEQRLQRGEDGDDPIAEISEKLGVDIPTATAFWEANKPRQRTRTGTKTASSIPCAPLGEPHIDEMKRTEGVDMGEMAGDEQLPTWARQEVEAGPGETTTSEAHHGTGMQSSFDADAADQSVNELKRERNAHLWRWITGDELSDDGNADTRMQVATISVTRVLQTQQRMVCIRNQTFIVVPSTEAKVIFGRRSDKRIRAQRDADPSPLRQATPAQQQEEVDRCIRTSLDEVKLHVPEISAKQMQRLTAIVMGAKKTVWRSKYALDEPAHAPPMRITLKPGARPPKRGLP